MSASTKLDGRKLLVLGAGLWQVPYLRKARELGLRVYATDWSAEAEGRSLADVFEPIDLRDLAGTLAFARKAGVEAVFTSADIGVPAAAHVARQLGLPGPDEALAEAATNKHAMRAAARQGGLPIPEFRMVDQLDQAAAAAEACGYPCIVKPVDNCSSRGVFHISTPGELAAQFPESLEASPSRQVLVESFMQGTEGSAEGLVRDGRLQLLGICDKIKSPLPYRYDLELNYPGQFTPEQYEALHRFLDQLVAVYAIRNGVIHVEFIIQDCTVRLIEFAIRGCGTNVITHLLPATTGFDCTAWVLKAAFGIHEEISLPLQRAGLLRFIMLPDQTIEGIEGLEEARNSPGIVDFHLDRSSGERVGKIKDGRSRPGHLIAVGDTREEAGRRADQAMQELKISLR